MTEASRKGDMLIGTSIPNDLLLQNLNCNTMAPPVDGMAELKS